MKKTSLIIGTMISSLVLGTMVAHASDDQFGKFTVHPSYTHQGNKSWIIQDIANGSSVKDSLTLENLSDQEQKISLIVREATNEKGKFTPVESEKYTGLGLWTKLSENQVTLAPREKKKIPFEISVPENSFEKEYNGVIYALKEDSNDQNIKIVTRIGVRIYIHVVAPSTLQTNIFNSSLYKSSFFFILSLIGLTASIGYNLIHIIENKKYAKKNA